MIEIAPHDDTYRGSYIVPLVVDEKAYRYIYNDFVKEWNQYVKKHRADPEFLKSKVQPEDSPSEHDVSIDSLPFEEKVKLGESAGEFLRLRGDKKGEHFQKLVDDFDRERKLIACYNSKFYTYKIISKFADFISVYMLEEKDLANILNYFYLTLKKPSRSLIREQLFRGSKTLLK